ncbi:uncharacterized protein LOC122757666 [Drosophila mojavensis]|uniref:uncharacterized protein LOC122757666 n=1 Tax=Drosophila mojavensis TaxID=7230 RepID=UPI001CD0A1FC|nr:uncharacterized protein LOC122757666 [Drosophila mojavensis]
MANLDASAVAPEDRVRFYKLKVQSVFERVKKLQSKVDSDALADHSDSTLNVLLEHIDKLSHSFSKAHESLEELDFTEMSSNLRTDFDDLIMVMQSTIMSEVQSRTAQVHHSSTFSRPSDPPRASAPRLQAAPALPPLKLPTFSGGYANWADFYSMFSTIIESRPEISNMERLQHLRSCLDGAALDTVRSLEISNDNYTIAINLLKQRYDNRRLIFQAHIVKILGLKRVENGSIIKLRELSDSFNVHMRALSSLGTTEQIASAMIAQILLQKLDEASQAKWEEKLDNSETALQIPRYEEVSSFLELRCRTLESMKFALTNYSSSKPMNSCSKVATSRSAFLVTGHSTHSCNFCNDLEHTIYKCPRFANLSPSLRLNEVRKAGLCLNCLKGGHQSRQCGSRSCRVCGVKHHTLLHLGHSSTSQAAITPHQQSSTSRVQTIPQPSAPATTLLSKDRHSDVVLLATAVVLARNRFGELVPCRALLDSGSQLHLITARFANLLQLKRTKSVASVCGVGDSNVAMDGSSICLTLQAHASEYTTSITAMVATNITGRQPSSNVNTSNWSIPQNIVLADPAFHRPQRVDLLIGASLFYDLLCVGQIKLMPGLPLLQKTRLGWVVSGGEARNHNSVLIASKTPLDPITDSCADIKLDSLVRRFWEVERCSDSIVKFSKEDSDCEAHFARHYNRLASGQYTVRLPVKLSCELLGDSYEQARHRFLNLEKKLSRLPHIKSQYSAFLKEYLELGHMSRVPLNSFHLCRYFLPHHCVLKDDSTTTKLRVVFDGSASTTTGHSLNDILMSGPVIQPKLVDILLRFRSYPVALTGDICKMYRCVKVPEPDSYLQCILWRNSPDDELEVFRLDTVTYGTKPASFLSVRAMHQLAVDERNAFPVGSWNSRVQK